MGQFVLGVEGYKNPVWPKTPSLSADENMGEENKTFKPGIYTLKGVVPIVYLIFLWGFS